MLLRFTAPDLLNTSLTYVATGERAYDISTIFVEETAGDSQPPHCSTSGSSSQATRENQMPPKSSETMASSSPAFVKQSHAEEPEDPMKCQIRKTTITDGAGTVVADIQWMGRHPSISICGEKVGGLADLFGSTSVPFQPKILAIPTRFDTEYIWTATPDSLTLYDYESESVRGTFHHNVFRFPAKSKGFKVKSSPSYCDTPVSPTSPSPSFATTEHKSPNYTFFPAHVPSLGSNYLEFESHPLAHDIEIILSFLMMEILRLGRFNLTPYTFDKPKIRHFKDAKNMLLGHLRRHTI